MQKIAVILFLLSLSILCLGQGSEIQNVEKTLNFYLEGGTNNDFATLEKAFHPNAMMKSVGEEYREVNAVVFFRNAIKPGPKSDRKTRIVSINVTGNVAHGILEIQTNEIFIYDYMNMIKFGKEWKIVSKIFTVIEKE